MAYKQKSSIGSLCNSKGPMNMGNVLANPGDTGVQKNSSPAEKSLVGNQKNLPAHLVKAISDAPGEMTGSPLNSSGHGRTGAHVHVGGVGEAVSKVGKYLSDFGASGRTVKLRSKKDKSSEGSGNTTSVKNNTVGPKSSPNSETKPAPDPFKGDFSKPNKKSSTVKRKKVETVGKIETKGVTKKGMGKTTGGGMTGAKVKVSQEIKTQDKDKTNKGIKEVAAKQASAPKEMSRKQIREAKQKDKASGMSRKEVRANKLKRKASSARAKTTSKETAAKGGKEAQRLSRKTIRLEKKVAKQEGRVKASKM